MLLGVPLRSCFITEGSVGKLRKLTKHKPQKSLSVLFNPRLFSRKTMNERTNERNRDKIPQSDGSPPQDQRTNNLHRSPKTGRRMQRQIPPIVLLPRIAPRRRIQRPRQRRLPPLRQFVQIHVVRIAAAFGGGSAVVSSAGGFVSRGGRAGGDAAHSAGGDGGGGGGGDGAVGSTFACVVVVVVAGVHGGRGCWVELGGMVVIEEDVVIGEDGREFETVREGAGRTGYCSKNHHHHNATTQNTIIAVSFTIHTWEISI